MAEEEHTEEVEEVEAPEEEEEPEADTEEAAMLHFGRYSEMRRAVPWEQKTTMEKASYYMDRFFLVFFIVFIIVMIGDISYKIWYVTNMQKIKEFGSELVSWLFTFVSNLVSWLFTYVSNLMSSLFTHEEEKFEL